MLRFFAEDLLRVGGSPLLASRWPRRMGWLCVYATLAACTSKPHQPVGEHRLADGFPVSLIYVPTDHHVYVELFHDGRRYADIEVSVGGKVLSFMASGTLGEWMGGTLSTVPNAPIFDPVSTTINVVAVPLIVGSIEAQAQAQAQDKARPFRDLIRSWEEGQGQQVVVLKHQLDHSDHVSPLRVEVVDDVSTTKSLIGSMPSDLVLVTSGSAAFTPQFEVLEVKLHFALFRQSVSVDEPLYANSVVSQSKVHAGNRDEDTRNELVSAIDDTAAAERRSLMSNPVLSAWERRPLLRNIESRATYRKRRADRAYALYDEHDPYGALWLAEDGTVFRRALAAGYAEAARVALADLAGLSESVDAARVAPPGFDYPMRRQSKLDHDGRHVYQLESGPLISIDAHSRMIPFSVD